MIYNVYKPAGWTPRMALDRLREMTPELQGVKAAYAGRLDPMAEGVLLIVAGEELKKFEEYCRLDKVYEAEILLGLSSDSWDVMGLVDSDKVRKVHKVIKSVEIEIEEILKQFEGKVRLPLPAYSSAPYKGKSLYWHARHGTLPKVLPERENQIYAITYEGMSEVTSGDILQSVTARIEKVQGDFRQQEILARWREIVHDESRQFQAMRIKVHCSSGTYIRSLAVKIGQHLGASALLYRLFRMRVGDYFLSNAMNIID